MDLRRLLARGEEHPLADGADDLTDLQSRRCRTAADVQPLGVAARLRGNDERPGRKAQRRSRPECDPCAVMGAVQGRVSPVAGSTARTCTERWSRVCTETTGPRMSQSAVATYSNAGSVHVATGWSGPAASGSWTTTRSPDTRTTCSDTSAFAVPAAGYAITRGGRSGSAGSLRYLRCTMDVSTRATSSASPDGDHQ